MTPADIPNILIMAAVGYLIGSLPFGVAIGKAVAKVDVREYGSGSMGMTNVLRTVGKPAAAAVLLLDMGKGVAAVLIAKWLFDSPPAEVAGALAALIGHNWPVFIGFRGGRGTASGWGALWVLSPIAGFAATVIGLALVAITRYVSLGSIVAAALGSLVLIGLAGASALVEMPVETPPVYFLYGAIGGAIVVFRHRENISRLIAGTERKIGQPADISGGAG